MISTIDNTAFPGTTLRDSQYLQQLANNTKLSYTMFSLSQSVTVRLQAEGTPCDFWWHIYTSYLCSRLKLGRPTWVKHFWVKKNPVSVKNRHIINLNALHQSHNQCSFQCTMVIDVVPWDRRVGSQAVQICTTKAKWPCIKAMEKIYSRTDVFSDPNIN